VTPQQVMKKVAEVLRIGVEEMRSAAANGLSVQARQMGMYLMRPESPIELPRIGGCLRRQEATAR